MMNNEAIISANNLQRKTPVIALRKPQTPQQYFRAIHHLLNRAEYAYLSVVIDCMGKKLSAEITQKEIANETKYSTRTIKRAQKSLEEKGIIKVIHQHGYNPNAKNGLMVRCPSLIRLTGMEG